MDEARGKNRTEGIATVQCCGFICKNWPRLRGIHFLNEYITVYLVGYARQYGKATVAVYLIWHDKVYDQAE